MPRREKIALIMLALGAMLCLDTLLIARSLRALLKDDRMVGESLPFVFMQEAMLVIVVLWVAWRAGRNSTPVPIYISYLGVIATSWVSLLLGLLVFNILLGTGVIGVDSFRGMMWGRQIFILVPILLVTIAGIIHQGSSAGALAAREIAIQLSHRCKTLASRLQLQDADLAGAIERLGEDLRFSEGVRRDAVVAQDVKAKVDEMWRLSEESPVRLERLALLVREAGALAA